MARIDELDYYQLLGVSAEASPDDIQRAFHAFARKYHPDAHRQDPAAYARYVAVYRRGTEAYRVLRSDDTRRAYDATLAQGQRRYSGSLRAASVKPPRPKS